MADCLEDYHHEFLTTEKLTKAYEQLAAMFSRFEISATFAFVMAMLLREDELGEFDDLLLGDRTQADPWLEDYRQARSAGSIEGWHLPEALDIARRDGRHENACHGFCHRSLADGAISTAGTRTELAAAHRVADLKGVRLRTLVFPRNQVGHVDEVREAGFIGYRDRLRRPGGIAGRAFRIADEFNVLSAPQKRVRADHGLVPIPPGYFFNWRHGLRRLVSPGVTRTRWRNMLRQSASEGGVVHLWLHPHNLATVPAMADALERTLSDVAEMNARGELRVLTQDAYCREVLAGR